MASLQPQTWIRPGESYFLLAGAINYNSPAIFTNTQTNTTEGILVGANITDLQLKVVGGQVLNTIRQTTTGTDFFVGSTTTYPNFTIRPGTVSAYGKLEVTDYPNSNLYLEIIAGDNTNPSYIYNHGSQVPGGIDSSILFRPTGIIETTPFVKIGPLNAQSNLTIGPPSDNVVLGPDRYAFQANGTITGGVYQLGSTILLSQGADPINTGVGITVGPSTMGFRKPIDAKNGNSINAQGSIISSSTADNVGGLIQAYNGNYVLNMQAIGDGHSPYGVGGQVYSFNNGNGQMSPTVFYPGLNSNITGPSDGILNITAGSTINLNAPQVLINGGLISNPSFFYQLGGSEQAINGNNTLGSGSFLGWNTILYQSPGYAGRFVSPDTTFWICPVAGVYQVTVNLICNQQDARGSTPVALCKLPANGSPVSLVGAQITPPGYQPNSNTSPPIYYAFVQLRAGSLCGTFITPLAANDKLYMCGGQNADGGVLYVQPSSTWSLQYVAAQ